MPEYTVATALAMALVVAIDLAVARTRLLHTSTFWITLAITWSFQVFVDGWLTDLSSPIVRYDPDHFSGVRVFFDSPIEDFGFGFALILSTLSVWEVLGRRGGDTGAGGARRDERSAAEVGP